MLELEPPVDRSWWAILPACGLDHDEYHTLLDGHVRLGGVPDQTGYSRWARKLVAEAWAHRPAGHLPYTLDAEP